ncbi:lipase family alpha/beta hydrolase [Rossellomorea sp. LJF3]|uniref:lipase family alpha/beta hydrolase n=1 Tax=Rossellomorea sp. LJF3 TaxID=3126099 RepID=UPI00300D5284
MFKKISMTILALFLFLPSWSQAGSFGNDDPSGVPGQWYVGTTPSYVAPSKQPILFVHGLNSSSNTWWNENNMYETAYQNGYETAFIDLYPTKNMWDNGALLAQKIREIYNYYGEKVVVVAHSKGGIDTQSALVHYGAFPYVSRVITLSTPHHGSQLADLAYSSWAGWLAGILGSKNDATYSLQTGYMAYFRSDTDQHVNVNKNPIYTFGGTKWGGFGSSLYWGGLYLWGYGSNDGAVTVNSSRLPYATELRVGDWNHFTIKEGSSTFNLFRDYLNESTVNSSGAKVQSSEQSSSFLTDAASFVRGGETNGNIQEKVLIEEGAESVTFDWISNRPASRLALKDPSGKMSTSFNVKKDDSEYFNGAYHHTITIQKPATGEWTLESHPSSPEKYLMVVSFDSVLNDSVEVNIVQDEIILNNKDKKVDLIHDMTLEYYKNGKLKEHNVKAKNGSLKLPKLGEGVYNITIDLDGKKNKNKFNRTIINTIYVDSTGKVFAQ